MVNTGATTTTTTIPSNAPQIQVSLNTYISKESFVADVLVANIERFCSFSLLVSRVKLPLAINTFNRAFGYIQSLANNDINPVPMANQSAISSSVNNLKAYSFNPDGLLDIQVDKSEVIPTVTLNMSSNNLRLDYMDEFFARTLLYLTLALEQDMNPDV